MKLVGSMRVYIWRDGGRRSVLDAVDVDTRVASLDEMVSEYLEFAAFVDETRGEPLFFEFEVQQAEDNE